MWTTCLSTLMYSTLVRRVQNYGQDIKEIGSNKTTIKWLYGNIEFIGFFMSKEKKKELNVGRDVDMQLEVIGTPTINTFRDKDTKQIVIKEWEICRK